jgi:hypothetical protein
MIRKIALLCLIMLAMLSQAPAQPPPDAILDFTWYGGESPNTLNLPADYTGGGYVNGMRIWPYPVLNQVNTRVPTNATPVYS